MLFEDLERQRGANQRHQENAARLAQVYAKFETAGMGFVEFEDMVEFGVTFVEEPFPAYSAKLDLDELANLQQTEGDASVPLTSGYVTEWDQDDRGNYVGAWVAARVVIPEASGDQPFPVTHYFTFSGIAMKDVPVEVVD